MKTAISLIIIGAILAGVATLASTVMPRGPEVTGLTKAADAVRQAAMTLPGQLTASADRPEPGAAGPVRPMLDERVPNPVPLTAYTTRDAPPTAAFPTFAVTGVLGASELTLYRPSAAKAGAPLMVLLPGRGRTAAAMVDRWRATADRYGLMLAGVTVRVTETGPTRDLLRFLARLPGELRTRLGGEVGPAYLFGHSVGAGLALTVAARGSTAYAGIAVHGGYLPPEAARGADATAGARPPVVFVVGDRDHAAPVAAVRMSADWFAAARFPVAVMVLTPHNHWYYSAADTINALALRTLARLEGGG